MHIWFVFCVSGVQKVNLISLITANKMRFHQTMRRILENDSRWLFYHLSRREWEYLSIYLDKASKKLNFLIQTNSMTPLYPVLSGQSLGPMHLASLVHVQPVHFLNCCGNSKLLRQINPCCNQVRKKESEQKRMSTQRMAHYTAVNKRGLEEPTS